MSHRRRPQAAGPAPQPREAAGVQLAFPASRKARLGFARPDIAGDHLQVCVTQDRGWRSVTIHPWIVSRAAEPPFRDRSSGQITPPHWGHFELTRALIIRRSSKPVQGVRCGERRRAHRPAGHARAPDSRLRARTITAGPQITRGAATAQTASSSATSAKPPLRCSPPTSTTRSSY